MEGAWEGNLIAACTLSLLSSVTRTDGGACFHHSWARTPRILRAGGWVSLLHKVRTLWDPEARGGWVHNPDPLHAQVWFLPNYYAGGEISPILLRIPSYIPGKLACAHMHSIYRWRHPRRLPAGVIITAGLILRICGAPELKNTGV